MTPEFTPGPWEAETPMDDMFAIVRGEGPHSWQWIATVHIDSPEECDGSVPVFEKEAWANAQLIKNAPDLFKALTDVVVEADRETEAFQNARQVLARVTAK